MDSVELVKKICKERKIPISRLERDCGFSNGYIRKLQEGKFPSDRLLKIAQYLDVPFSYLMTGEEKENGKRYYINEETGKTAQEIFEKDRVLFDVYRSADKDKLVEYAEMLKALREKEEGN